MIDLKQELYLYCVREIDSRIGNLRNSLKGFQEAANEETKSSAGDKYETGRAMMHLEKEKVAHSLNEVLKQKKVLDMLKPELSKTKVELGSLVKTSKGLFFLSISLGQVKAGGETVFCISPVSPIGQVLLGAEKSASVTFNKMDYSILDLV
ncbi:MAG: 3-oxoacyl-ACP synthase [Marinoscillum sp.]